MTPAQTRAMFDRLWATRRRCVNGHELAAVGLRTRIRFGGKYRTRECAECVREQKARAYRREMSDPDRAERRRERNRRAAADYRARRKGNAA